MKSIKLIDKEIEQLRLKAQGKHKEAEKLAGEVLAGVRGAAVLAGSMRQADHDNRDAHELEERASELEDEKAELHSRLTEVEAEQAKLRDKYEGDKVRLEADYKQRHNELESERLRIIG
ncbi:MAG: hypothetical protein ACR2PP_11215 [Psychrobacter sp.]